MVSSASPTVAAYLASLPADRRKVMTAVRKVIKANLPRGFKEAMQHRMIGYYVPLKRYPDTYNGQPLLLAGLASQKGYMSVYLMSVYADPALRAWFEKGYQAAGKKLDMGKSCVRFKSLDDLSLELVGAAIGKVSLADFLARYEAIRARAR